MSNQQVIVHPAGEITHACPQCRETHRSLHRDDEWTCPGCRVPLAVVESWEVRASDGTVLARAETRDTAAIMGPTVIGCELVPVLRAPASPETESESEGNDAG